MGHRYPNDTGVEREEREERGEEGGGPRRWLRGLFVVEEPDSELVGQAPPVPIRQIFARFWPYTRGLRKWLPVTLLFIALDPVLDAVGIWLFKLLVDEVLVPRDFDPFLPLAVAYIVLTLLSGAVSFADDVLSEWVGQRFVLSLRTDLFRHLQRLSLNFFDRRQLGDVLTRLTGDVQAIESFVLSGLAEAISSVLRLVVFVGVLLYLRWDLTLVALLVAPLFWVVARHFARLLKQASRERRRRSGSITAVAEESLGNVALVQSYNREGWELARFRRENLAKFRADMTAVRLQAFFSPLIDALELLGGLLVIGLGAWHLSRGELTLGGLLAFVAFLTQLYSPIRDLGRLANTVYAASAAAERVIEVLDERPAVVELPDARRPGRARGLVDVESLTFNYPGTARPALASVSFQARPGETLALVGASGAGKSTLAKLLLRFYDPTEGRIRVDGYDLRELNLEWLRENVAVLLQETLVFDGTVRDNIAYGRPDATEAEIIEAARAADAHEFIRALPDGYDTVLGQRGRLLSGGQRQRVAIARAMIRDAPILLLDEPTTGLDAEASQRILEPLRRLMRGRTTIVISHNLLTVTEADQIVVLEHGRVVETGRHAELLAANRGYAQLYRIHAASHDGIHPSLERP
ncbi:ABC transporter ATP-binding protein [Carbonactinospora thermoautotrophica]|uniref:ABC transporter ATP-binding protein n=1 Tax=Carbonactinospora thermoautotrophica TaxID=1469144 RepID=UPI00099E2988|nr:ABC transporter ATP-binding protein [Carbonactinospora thermoautotrophica]